jgi:hypothetical protein
MPTRGIVSEHNRFQGETEGFPKTSAGTRILSSGKIKKFEKMLKRGWGGSRKI